MKAETLVLPTASKETTDMDNGIVVTIQSEKGFFFIRSDEDRTEYFAHKSSLQNRVRIGQLLEGDRCTFHATISGKGPRAESVVILRLAKVQDWDPLSFTGL